MAHPKFAKLAKGSDAAKSSNSLHVIQSKFEFEQLMKDYVMKEDEPPQPEKISERKRLKLQKIKERKSQSLPTKHPDAEERTIFVGNVSIEANRKKVENFFAKYGEVESVRFRGIPADSMDISKKEAAATKRFHPHRESLVAYVRFKDIESKEKALEANGTVFHNLHLRVDNSIGSSSQREKNCVFVGNLAWEINEEELWEHFKDCGKITNVRVVRSSTTGAGKGFAFVSFESKSGVDMALYFNGKPLNDRPLRIKKAVKKVKEKKKFKHTIKSGTSSILQGKNSNSNKLNLNFLKRDKPQMRVKKIKEKHGKRKRKAAFEAMTNGGNTMDFSGCKVSEDGKRNKNKRRKHTQTEKKNFAFAKVLTSEK